MDRLTLSEAQARVASIRQRENLDPVGWNVQWADPAKEALMYSAVATRMDEVGDRRLCKAARGIAAALVAHHTHLAFEAGRAFSDAASARYLDAEGRRAEPIGLLRAAAEIREGLHYAEPGEG